MILKMNLSRVLTILLPIFNIVKPLKMNTALKYYIRISLSRASSAKPFNINLYDITLKKVAEFICIDKASLLSSIR
jgi:hypothetical protein